MNKEESTTETQSICYRAFELMRARQFDDAEKLISNALTKTPEDDVAIALFHSTLGVLYKMKGDYKGAWRHYERAEKLLPHDPALKLISARLLMDQFSQHAQAIKKAKQVLDIIPDNPVFVHQAWTVIGEANLKRSSKKEAIACLKKSVVGDFKDFITGQNIDFGLVEALLRKNIAIEESKVFLKKAYEFVKEKKEHELTEKLQIMLNELSSDESTNTNITNP